MRGLILFAALTAAGCNDMPQARSEAEIRRIAAETSGPTINRLQSRIDELEQRVNRQAEEISTVRNVALSTADAHESLRKTFNGNVDIENNNKARQMTARGGCGQEWVTYPDGGRAWRNKECTVKDLP